jgi:hypothetical protein
MVWWGICQPYCIVRPGIDFKGTTYLKSWLVNYLCVTLCEKIRLDVSSANLHAVLTYFLGIIAYIGNVTGWPHTSPTMIQVIKEVFEFTAAFHYANFSSNYIIYAFSMDYYRAECKKLFCCVKQWSLPSRIKSVCFIWTRLVICATSIHIKRTERWSRQTKNCQVLKVLFPGVTPYYNYHHVRSH